MATGMKFVKYLDSKRIQGRNGYVNGIVGATADLTVTGATQGTAGKIGNCIDFDGSNDYATAQTGQTTLGRSEFNFMHQGDGKGKPRWTVSFWLNTVGITPSDDEYLFGTHTGTNEGFSFKINGTTSLLIHIAGSNGNYLTRGHMPSIIETDSNWHHYVVTYDHTIATDAINMWVDGVKENAGNAPSNNREGTPTSEIDHANAFRIGASASDASQPFRGKFDEMSFWNRILTDSEIEDELYDGTNAGTTTTDAVEDLTGLKVFYNFNEASGTCKNVTDAELDDKTTLVVAPIAGITDEKFVNPDANTALQWEQGVAAYKVEGNKILAGHTLIGKTISEISGYYFSKSGITFTETVSAHLFNSNGTKKGSFGTINVNDTHREADQGLHDTAEIESHGGLVSGSAVVAEGDIIGFMNDWALDSGTSEWCSMGKKESDSALTDTHYQQLATFVWTGSALTPTLTDDKSIQCQVKTAIVAGTSNLQDNSLFEGIDDHYSYILDEDSVLGSVWKPRKISSPLEMSNCRAWWDMSDISVTTVSLVKDKSGNDFHLYQDASDDRPTLQTNQQNSLQALRFLENDDHMIADFGTWGERNNYGTPPVDVGGFSLNAPCTIFWVGNLRDTGNTQSAWKYYLFDIGDIGEFYQYQSNWGMRTTEENANSEDFAWSDGARGNYTENTWTHITMVWDNTDEGGVTGQSGNFSKTEGSIFRCDGVETKISGLGTTQNFARATWFNLNGYNQTDDYGGNQDVGEIIVFDRRLKPAEILTVENYIKDKWGL